MADFKPPRLAANDRETLLALLQYVRDSFIRKVLDQPCPAFDDEPVVNLRWILAHLVEEIARHAGHADILRETIDGSTGR